METHFSQKDTNDYRPHRPYLYRTDADGYEPYQYQRTGFCRKVAMLAGLLLVLGILYVLTLWLNRAINGVTSSNNHGTHAPAAVDGLGSAAGDHFAQAPLRSTWGQETGNTARIMREEALSTNSHRCRFLDRAASLRSEWPSETTLKSVSAWPCAILSNLTLGKPSNRAWPVAYA